MIRKKLLLKIVIAILIVAAGVGMINIGGDLRNSGFDSNKLLTPVYIGILIAVLIFLVNLILMKRFQNIRIQTDLMEKRIFEKKQLAEENFLKYYKKVKSHIILSDLYFIFLSLLLLSIYLMLCLVLKARDFYILILAGATFYISFSYLIGKDVPQV